MEGTDNLAIVNFYNSILTWWAFFMFLYLLEISLPFHLV